MFMHYRTLNSNIHKIRVLLLITVLCCFTAVAFAGTENRLKIWTGFDISNSLKPNSKWHYDFFTQPRFANNQILMEQAIIRPSIYYQYNDNWSYWFGYDFNPFIPRGNSKVYYEQRLWPQIQYTKDFNHKLKLTSRSRYEVRGINDSPQVATRFRQRFEATIIGHNPLNVSYDLFYEGFFKGKGADWVPEEFVDQNRYYFGFEIPTTKTTILNLGYMKLVRPRSPDDRVDHILSIGISVNLEKSEAGPVATI